MIRMFALLIGLMLALSAGACSSRKSSLLLERRARGPLDEALLVGQETHWALMPLTQTQSKRQIEVTVRHADLAFLETFFGDEVLFGDYAGKVPYYPQHLVFYVQLVNNSDEEIMLKPELFALIDDRGNQYTPISLDYVTALSESKQPMMNTARGALSSARPGYFGFSVPIGKMVAGKSQWQYFLIQQSSLQRGLMHPKVVHDGLIAFWAPSSNAKSFQLLLSDITTDFAPDGYPNTALEFHFEFQQLLPQQASPTPVQETLEAPSPETAAKTKTIELTQ